MDIKYAMIHHSQLTEEHIQLIRATGLNTVMESVVLSREDVNPRLCLIEWDNDIAQTIPAAAAAVQQMVDAGVTFLTEAEVKPLLSDPASDFYPATLP